MKAVQPLALALWFAAAASAAQTYLPQGSLPGVTFEIVRGDSAADNCRDFVVTNRTASFVDAYVRFDYRFESTTGTSRWIGTKTVAVDGPFARIPAHFANLHPGESRRLKQFEMHDGPGSSGEFEALWFEKMLASRENWNAADKCATWDYEIVPAADALRSEVSDVQRLLERKIAERDARLREVAEATAKMLGISVAATDRGSPARKGPGTLLAEADEMAQRGDRSGAQRLLRQLVADHPAHPFAAYSADRLTALAAPPPIANDRPAPNLAAAGNPRGEDCEQALARHERDVNDLNQRPSQSTLTMFRRVMWATSTRIDVIRSSCPDTAEYRAMTRELRSAFEQAEQACAATAGGRCPGPGRD